MSHVVLITGCSTGIGRDLAQRLAQAGSRVVATARRLQTLQDVPAALKLPLDVTQPDSVSQAVGLTVERFGRIDALVNNAGYAVRGAVEEVSDRQAQQMFDVNVFGALRLVRAVAPHMRRQNSGRIINISSIAGQLATPVNGTYSASKFALEALSDTLRWELAPFGIQVVLIEPGSIKTQFSDTAEAHAQEILSNPATPYQALYRQAQRVTSAMRQNEPGPEVVSKVIVQALEVPSPRARYLVAVPLSARLVLHLGDTVWDLVLRRLFDIVPAQAAQLETRPATPLDTRPA